jgi:uncharacterized protein involved in response to NO
MPKHPPLFNLGFRPFFLGASIYSIISIGAWLLFLNQALSINTTSISTTQISPFQWHAHEMIYGYSVAVIAGFLLTAVKNWTGIQTPHGLPLVVLFSTWAIARLLWLFDSLSIASIFDLVFMLLLSIAVATPIIQKKQWRQMAILSKLILIAFGNAFFYAQALGLIDFGAHTALYAGLYIVVGLILTIGRRIIPLFIKNGVNYEVELYNSRALDISSMLGFVLFFIFSLFTDYTILARISAALMVIITTIRMIGWYTPGIWSSPLLWSFFVTLGSITAGFGLYALEGILGLSPYLSVHAFALGAIGVMTLGMMARVSTGHTGRSVKQPHKLLTPALGILTLSTVIRVFFPAIFPDQYLIWINVSGLGWLLSFGVLCIAFIPIWSKPRIDGKYG